MSESHDTKSNSVHIRIGEKCVLVFENGRDEGFEVGVRAEDDFRGGVWAASVREFWCSLEKLAMSYSVKYKHANEKAPSLGPL